MLSIIEHCFLNTKNVSLAAVTEWLTYDSEIGAELNSTDIFIRRPIKGLLRLKIIAQPPIKVK